MKFYLIVTKGKKLGMPIPITVDLFMIGTTEECQLKARIEGVGERHCALVRREKKVFVQDLSSGEPTLVNGTLVPPGVEWPLHPGDLLEAGPLSFLMQFREKELSRKDLEEWALGCLDQTKIREFDDPDELLSTQRRQKPTTAASAANQILDRLAAVRGEVLGRLRVGKEGLITVIRFNDRFLVEEAEIALVNKELHDHLHRPNLRVLLDCKNVKRMSTAAVLMIDGLCTWLKPWGSSLALCRVRPEILGAMDTLGLKNKIPTFPDKRSALEGKW